MIELDGSMQEGGGQILRTALALSVLTRKPFSISKIRANRSNPGLAPQHLAAVNALAEISNADVDGAQLKSTALTFTPKVLKGGTYVFDVSSQGPSAGSATLLFQALLPALLYADNPSHVTFRGGTHVPWSPPYEFLPRVFLPAVSRFGAKAELAFKQPGYYPAGKGEFVASITPIKKLQSISLTARGPLTVINGVSTVSNLPLPIAQRQKTAALAALTSLAAKKTLSTELLPAASPGTSCFLTCAHDEWVNGFGALGEKGKPAETVGAQAAQALLEFEKSGACVETHLADQLIPYAALAEGNTLLACQTVSQHLKTNLAVCQAFLPALAYSVEEASARVEIRGTGFTRR